MSDSAFLARMQVDSLVAGSPEVLAIEADTAIVVDAFVRDVAFLARMTMDQAKQVRASGLTDCLERVGPHRIEIIMPEA